MLHYALRYFKAVCISVTAVALFAAVTFAHADANRPLFQRTLPQQTFDWTKFRFGSIDLSDPGSHIPPDDYSSDLRNVANSQFDARAAAGMAAAVSGPATVLNVTDLLEWKDYQNYDGNPSIYVVRGKCLAMMAYTDYFPTDPFAVNYRSMVSQAILMASPGWCGTYGPDALASGKMDRDFEGNYDMTEMFLLPIAYSYYDELTPAARDYLITQLLARGRIRRPNLDDTFTSGPPPDDWSRAGFSRVAGVKFADIPETENHVLCIATARYLTNQLMYQRTHDGTYDNRRATMNGGPTCMDQLLGLLGNELQDDFAEYNAKPYQEETRHALLNLCTYSYDQEVRLAARMVLDQVAAHIAVSSQDLRRLVPFRRRDENTPESPRNAHPNGSMDVSLLFNYNNSADPMGPQFALLAGNTRAYLAAPPVLGAWNIAGNFGEEFSLETASTYRLPPSIHDLFVNDKHRRFYQRLHRHTLLSEPGQQRNADNLEIFSGSPSYLITAGGRPGRWVIPGDYGHGYQDQNRGAAVTNSFIPMAGTAVGSLDRSLDVIQLGLFSDIFPDDAGTHGGNENYGVGPDFMCGWGYNAPFWADFGNSILNGLRTYDYSSPNGPGFYLAIYRQDLYVVLEAFDTWLHPEVTYQQFQDHIFRDNPNLSSLASHDGQEQVYQTYFGNRIHYVIWTNLQIDNHQAGSKILHIEYANGDPNDTLSGAGNDADSFLSGTVMQTIADGITQIRNPYLGTTITLDMADVHHPKRTDENGKVEEAGNKHEVWVDFNAPLNIPEEGDFYHPFKTLAHAQNAVAAGGTIKIVSGATREKLLLSRPLRLKAPYGSAQIGIK